jgi:hypothetical protein
METAKGDRASRPGSGATGVASSFEAKHRRFMARLSFAIAALVTAGAGVVGILAFTRPNPVDFVAPSAFIVAVGLASMALIAWGRQRAGAAVMLATLFVVTCVAPVVSQEVVPETIFSFMLFSAFTAFLIGPRACLSGGAVALLALALANARALGRGDLASPSVTLALVGGAALAAMCVVLYLIARQNETHLRAHRDRLALDAALFERVPRATAELEAAAQELSVISTGQREGALRQASAVEETRSSLNSLVVAAGHIVSAAQGTLEASATTLSTAHQLATGLRNLAERTTGIVAISRSIREFARKSDLLALNAALEGTKAGEGGRGFSLVAGQMQKLAEGITQEVERIEALTVAIEQATAAFGVSTEETTGLARATNEAALRINLIASQQRSSVEQVATALDDIAEIGSRVVTTTDEVIGSSQSLRALSEHLMALVTEFRAAAQ